MRTIIIFDQMMESPICFLELEGDYTHLDRVYINSMEDERKQRELSELLYDPTDGHMLHQQRQTFPILKPGDKVIVAGFLP